MSFPLSLTGSVFTEVARESGTMIDCLGLLMIITGLTPRANEIVVVVVVVCVCVLGWDCEEVEAMEEWDGRCDPLLSMKWAVSPGRSI